MPRSNFSALRLPSLLGVLFLLGVGVTTQAQTVNKPPTISGTPPSWVYVGSQYYFRAQGYDPEGATLRYSIQNRPSWASFSTSTGVLSGTPTVSGQWNDIRITVSDGVSTSSALLFSIRAARRDNVAPVISGTPSTSVAVGSTYRFAPTASDENRDQLRFGIVNRPSWATFSSVTGQLSGAPAATHVGTYSNIVISVSDGRASTALAPFAITVVDTSSGAATLTWMPPTTNTDGSTLTTLAGYRIAYGSSAAQLTQTIQLANAGMSSYVVENLAPGTYYFAVRAYTSSGAESANSNVMSRIVR